MVATLQDEVVAFLEAPETHHGAPVERIDTHSAIVLLVGTRALKLKRAVKFDYLDFSTPERRRTACAAEVRINRRTAPTIYRGVGAVTREADGSLAINGAGTPIEWFVEMTRFDQEALFDRRAARGSLDVSWMRPLGEAVARFHLAAERRRDHGGRAGMAWVVDGNAQGFAEQGRDILDPALCVEVTARCRAELDRVGPLLDERREQGFVRQCHGDLHLRNIVLIDGAPTLFDAIEFNDEIACGDVLYDLSFLLMDLWRRQLPHHANAVFNGYMSATGDLNGLPLLPLFLGCRAAVRAKTSATAARVQADAARRRELEELARGYLHMARMLLTRVPPAIVAIGGFSGSGKSTLARALAPSVGAVPGALVLRSDELRKALCGIPALDRLPVAGYAPAVTIAVYEQMAASAFIAAHAGHSVIADAVFAHLAQRRIIERTAGALGTPFIGLWLDAPESVLASRTQLREHDASDATPAVVHQQVTGGAGVIAWSRLDAARPLQDVASEAEHLVRGALTAHARNDVNPTSDQLKGADHEDGEHGQSAAPGAAR